MFRRLCLSPILLRFTLLVCRMQTGEFKRNKKDGKGIFSWPSGNVYKGEFRQEKMCGKGEMSYATGHR